MLHYYELDDEYPEIARWYDGYIFGENSVFNPYCLVLCLRAILEEKIGMQKGLPPSSIGPYRCYWSNSSGNAIINDLIRKHPDERGDIEKQLANTSVEKSIYEFVTYRDLEHIPDVIWTILLYAGYLKAVKIRTDAESGNGRPDILLMRLQQRTRHRLWGDLPARMERKREATARAAYGA